MPENANVAAGDSEPDRADEKVHPGWSMATQDEYDLGVSGGWGTPGEHLTGPIPKIRRPAPPEQVAGEPDADGGEATRATGDGG